MQIIEKLLVLDYRSPKSLGYDKNVQKVTIENQGDKVRVFFDLHTYDKKGVNTWNGRYSVYFSPAQFFDFVQSLHNASCEEKTYTYDMVTYDKKSYQQTIRVKSFEDEDLMITLIEDDQYSKNVFKVQHFINNTLIVKKRYQKRFFNTLNSMLKSLDI